MDIEREVRDALHGGASNLTVEGAGPEAARKRAHRITRRRRVVPAAIAAAAVAGAGVAVAVNRDESEPAVVADGASTTDGTDGAADAPEAIASDLVWHEVDTTVLTPRAVVHGADGYTYALSTAPGTKYTDYPDGSIPQSLYRSLDGETWERTDLGEKSWMTDLDERDGVLYALGTGPATHAGQVQSTRAAMSDDGGESWTDVELPTEAQAPAAAVDLLSGSVQSSLVVGPNAMVASLFTTYFVDPESILTPEEHAANYMAFQTAEGFDIVDELKGCELSASSDAMACRTPSPSPSGRDATPVRSVTWADLGLSGPGALTVSELFVSSTGDDWERVDSPFAASVGDLMADADGFVASTYATDTSSAGLWRSPDGRTWTAATDQINYADHVGVLGSRMLAVQSTPTAVNLLVSDDSGATWSGSDLSMLLPGDEAVEYAVNAFDSGPLGAAVVVATWPAADRVSNTKAPENFLLTSTDGTTWTITPLDEIAGAGDNWVDALMVGTDHIVLSVASYTDAKQEWKTFVGTPTR